MLALTVMVTACELDEGPDVTPVPGYESHPPLCIETTTCDPHDDPRGQAYLVDDLAFTAPDRLTTEFLRSHMDEAVNSGGLNLVLYFLPREQTLAAGPSLDAGTCHAFREEPLSSTLLDRDGDTFRAEDLDVRLLMATERNEIVLDLVLPSSTIEGLISDEGLRITGGRGVGHGDRASIVSTITVEQARSVPMPLIGVTFCGLLSGSTGVIGDLSDDCMGDPSTWPSPPSGSTGTEPEYRVEISFEAYCIPLASG